MEKPVAVALQDHKKSKQLSLLDDYFPQKIKTHAMEIKSRFDFQSTIKFKIIEGDGQGTHLKIVGKIYPEDIETIIQHLKIFESISA